MERLVERTETLNQTPLHEAGSGLRKHIPLRTSPRGDRVAQPLPALRTENPSVDAVPEYAASAHQPLHIGIQLKKRCHSAQAFGLEDIVAVEVGDNITRGHPNAFVNRVGLSTIGLGSKPADGMPIAFNYGDRVVH